VDVGIKGGHSGDRVAGTLEPLGNCWNARVAWDAVDVGIKRGRCGDRVAGEAWHSGDAVDTGGC
jgi:hypothetical protein